MRTKVFLIPELCIFLLLVVSCSSYKAKEAQNTATPEPTATSSPATAAPDTAASQPPAQSSAPPASSSSATKAKSWYKEAPPTQSAAKAEAPVAPPTPTPTPKPVVIPAGTELSIRTTGPITTGTSQAKQQFEASLFKPIMVGNAVVVPKGAPVSGTIPQAKSAGRIQGEGNLTLVLTSMTVKGKPYQISTKPMSLTSKGRGKRSALMIGGGSGAGALIGGLAGGGKGAAIGALAGAGAGTAGATLTGKRDMTIPAETFLNFTLSKPLVLPPTQGGQAETGQADQGQAEKGQAEPGKAEPGKAEPDSSGLKDRSPAAQEPQSSQSPAPAQGSPTPEQRPPN
jgi:hypothetical protein